MTVIASWGGGTSNAYVSITAADSILSTTVVDYTAWTNATTAQREASVVQASRDVDARQYIGHRYYHDQNLEFPRNLTSRFPWNYTNILTTTNDPEQYRMKRRVEEATALQALFLLKNVGQQTHADIIQAGVKSWSEQVGALSTSVNYGSGASVAAAKLSADARVLLSDYLADRRVYRA